MTADADTTWAERSTDRRPRDMACAAEAGGLRPLASTTCSLRRARSWWLVGVILRFVSMVVGAGIEPAYPRL